MTQDANYEADIAHVICKLLWSMQQNYIDSNVIGTILVEWNASQSSHTRERRAHIHMHIPER